MKISREEELIIVSLEDDYGKPLNIHLPVVVVYEKIRYTDGEDADGRRGRVKEEYLINDYQLDYNHMKRHPEITLDHVRQALTIAERKFLDQVNDGTVGKCNLRHFMKGAP